MQGNGGEKASSGEGSDEGGAGVKLGIGKFRTR